MTNQPEGGDKKKTHETVGWRFKSARAIYRCTRYEKSCGFWMKVLEPPPDGQWLGTPHAVGDPTCVSERAIGRTFHRILGDENPVPHEQPCECSICLEEEL